jgi:hypothetical protein
VSRVRLVKGNTPIDKHEEKDPKIEDINFLRVEGIPLSLFDSSYFGSHVLIRTYHSIQISRDQVRMTKVDET